jgi:dihydropteroate synthase
MMATPTPGRWRIRGRDVPVGDRPLVMGIVNVTPDSFSDGGRFFDADTAVAHALDLERQGADILDVGGESTRPGSEPVAADEELRRVLPVVRRLAVEGNVPISIDTRRAAVARAAVAAGAHIVNDVSALSDPAMAGVVAEAGAGLVLMHMRGDPKTMQLRPSYQDVVAEVAQELLGRAQFAEAAGVPKTCIVLDPGLGFGKRTGHGVEDNAVLLRRLPELCGLEYPILVGASRKTFLGNLLGGLPIEQRLEASLAAAAVAVWNGASIVRVHDVAQTRRVVDAVAALRRA